MGGAVALWPHPTACVPGTTGKRWLCSTKDRVALRLLGRKFFKGGLKDFSDTRHALSSFGRRCLAGLVARRCRGAWFAQMSPAIRRSLGRHDADENPLMLTPPNTRSQVPWCSRRACPLGKSGRGFCPGTACKHPYFLAAQRLELVSCLHEERCGNRSKQHCRGDLTARRAGSHIVD